MKLHHEVQQILKEARKMNVDPKDLAEMAGLKRATFTTWTRKIEGRGVDGKAGFPRGPRASSVRKLWTTLNSLAPKNQGKATKGNGPEPQVMQLVFEEDLLARQQEQHEAQKVVMPPMAEVNAADKPRVKGAADILRGMIHERIASMTVLELALLLAHVEGEAK